MKPERGERKKSRLVSWRKDSKQIHGRKKKKKKKTTEKRRVLVSHLPEDVVPEPFPLLYFPPPPSFRRRYEFPVVGADEGSFGEVDEG